MAQSIIREIFLFVWHGSEGLVTTRSGREAQAQAYGKAQATSQEEAAGGASPLVQHICRLHPPAPHAEICHSTQRLRRLIETCVPAHRLFSLAARAGMSWLAVLGISLQTALAQFTTNGGVVYHGRCTNYGPTDQFSSNWETGSCKCWGASSYKPDTPCFDTIAAPSHVTAVNTNGGDFTATCGTCLAVTCVDGPTRGFDWSTYSTPACIGNATVFVQVTDSCPCQQNPSNVRWCCNDTATITRHLDLSTPAFAAIADVSAGVIDILFQVTKHVYRCRFVSLVLFTLLKTCLLGTQEVACPDPEYLSSSAGSGAVWSTWEAFAGTSLQDFSVSRPFAGDVLANIESAEAPAAPSLDFTVNRTGEIQPAGPFLRPGGGNVTGFTFTPGS